MSENMSYFDKIINVYNGNAPSHRLVLREADGDNSSNGNQPKSTDVKGNINATPQQQLNKPQAKPDPHDKQKNPAEYPERQHIDINKDIRVAQKRDFRAGITLLYAYFPKWRDILDWYDAFPMVMLFGVGGDRMIGFNLHYLPPQFRAAVADTMMRQKRGAGGFSYLRMKKYFANVPYGVLKFAVRTYLYSHIVSQVRYVPEVYLQQLLREQPPQFKKQSAAYIYNYIIRRIASH